jgi:hypothetical protein
LLLLLLLLPVIVLGQHQPHVVTQRQVVAVNVNLHSRVMRGKGQQMINPS